MDVDVVSERLLRQPEVVAEHLRLAQLGKRRRLRAAQLGREAGERVADRRPELVLDLRDEEPAFSRARELEQDGLVPARLVEGAERHRSTSASSSARRSMSAFVCTSVTE